MSAVRKRFYTQVGVAPQDDYFCVQLDGKTVHTPKGRRLHVPSANLAHAIAAEWDAQMDVITPHSMHMTTLACTCLDGVADVQSAVIDSLLPFVETDQLIFRDDKNEDFCAQQSAVLDTWVQWAERELNIKLVVTRGVMPVLQPAQNAQRLKDILEEMNVWQLTAVAHLVEQLRSAVLASAVFKGAMSAQEAFRLSNMEEHFQIEEWGVDGELQNRLERTQTEVLAAENFIALL